VDAEDRFLDALAGVTSPKQKRKIIGRLFIEVFEEEATRLGHMDFLAQGTLYPDVIERLRHGRAVRDHQEPPQRRRASGKMNLKLLEPLRELFKDEVRALGPELGLPDESSGAIPSPARAWACAASAKSPGTARHLREADAIFIEEIRRAGSTTPSGRRWCACLPVRSVGVQGDERTYEEVCSLRAVTRKTP
jgi:GMP synthase (glutamine-hydrolysing)